MLKLVKDSSNEAAAAAECIEGEHLESARTSINRTDLDTVILSVNDKHNFAMAYTDYVRLVEVLVRDARTFSALRHIASVDDTGKAVN